MYSYFLKVEGRAEGSARPSFLANDEFRVEYL
jgi:hypothetical protein